MTCVLYLSLKMASAQVVANDSPPQDYSQPHGHFQSRYLFIAQELVALSMSKKIAGHEIAPDTVWIESSVFCTGDQVL